MQREEKKKKTCSQAKYSISMNYRSFTILSHKLVEVMILLKYPHFHFHLEDNNFHLKKITKKKKIMLTKERLRKSKKFTFFQKHLKRIL